MDQTSVRRRSGGVLFSAPFSQLLLVLVVLVLLPWVVPIASAQCTVCADGTTTPVGSFGTTDCSLIAESIAMTPDSDPECDMIRLQGFMYCACPTFPTEQYCSLCDYTSSTSAAYQSLPAEYQSWVIPTLDNVQCQDVEFLSTDDNRCGSTALMEAAWFCGCTGDSVQRGQCNLCGSTDTAPNTRTLPPPLDSKTCAQRDREGGLFYNVDGNTCETLLLGDTFPSQFDYLSYCGCVESAEVPNLCSLCGTESSVQNPDATLGSNSSMTCAALEMATPYVLDTDYCTELQDQYTDLCCNPAPPPTATTTSSPAAAPSGGGSGGDGDAGDGENAAPAPASPPTPTAASGAAGVVQVGMAGAMGWIPILLGVHCLLSK